MLKDGARDGAVARAVHDYLYAYRHGQVSATLNILSVDLSARSVLVSRNNPCPFYVIDEQGMTTYNEPSTPIGLYSMTKPVITKISLRPYVYVVVFTDGILHAGRRYNESIELENYLGNFNVRQGRTAQEVTDDVLGRAVELDQNRPNDDMSVIVMAALPMESENKVRRMTVCFPVERA